jgi:hypothetical protein
MTDQFAGWRALLAGEPVQFDGNDPLPGYYRIRKGRGSDEWSPVGVWEDGGTVLVFLNSKSVPVDRVWPYCAKNPITYEVYAAVAERGEPWPDLHPAVTRHHNNAPPANSLEALTEAINDLAREAKTMIEHGAAKSQDESDRAADLSNEIAKLWKRADKARADEGQPSLDAVRAINDRWRGILEAANIYKALKDSVCLPFLAARKAAKAKAESEAREQAESATKAGRAEEAVEAAKRADAIAATKTTAGTRGRAVHLQERVTVTIIDRHKVMAFFSNNQKLIDVLQSLAQDAVAAGVEVPGTKVGKEDKAR